MQKCKKFCTKTILHTCIIIYKTQGICPQQLLNAYGVSSLHYTKSNNEKSHNLFLINYLLLYSTSAEGL